MPKQRRRHYKSQAGCLQCKTRRVKCDELQPRCSACIRRGETCEYNLVPATKQWQQEASQGQTLQSISLIAPTEAVYTAMDMRLFHNFTTTHHPPLPLGNFKTWTQVIPHLAHDHKFLMHAVLAFSATRTAMHANQSLVVTALHHRTLALRDLSVAINTVQNKDTTPITRDAIVGALYALAVQTSYLRDGWTDFLTLVRGCGLALWGISRAQAPSIWSITSGTSLHELHEKWSHDRSYLFDSELGSQMASSLASLQDLAETSVEKRWFEALALTARAIQGDALHAIAAVESLWALPATVPSSAFGILIDRTRHVTQALLAHWLAVIVLFRSYYDHPSHIGGPSLTACLPYWIIDIAEGILPKTSNTPPAEQSASTHIQTNEALETSPKSASSVTSITDQFTQPDALALEWPLRVARVALQEQEIT